MRFWDVRGRDFRVCDPRAQPKGEFSSPLARSLIRISERKTTQMNQTFRGGLALHRLVEDVPVDLLPTFLGSEAFMSGVDVARLHGTLPGGSIDRVRSFRPGRRQSSAVHRSHRGEA